MRVGLIADAHGNAAAMRYAIDAMVGRVARILMAGDAMDQYRFSNEVVELLLEHNIAFVIGNHDAVMLSPQGDRARTASHVKPSLVEFMMSAPSRLELDLDGKTLLMVHGSPWPPFNGYIYPNSPLLMGVGELGFNYVVLGHTHVRMAVTVGSTVVVNPGSVGETRDSSDRRLSYAILDAHSGLVEFELFDPPPD
jgi:putative phosphoesterase